MGDDGVEDAYGEHGYNIDTHNQEDVVQAVDVKLGLFRVADGQQMANFSILERLDCNKQCHKGFMCNNCNKYCHERFRAISIFMYVCDILFTNVLFMYFSFHTKTNYCAMLLWFIKHNLN